MKAKLSLFLVCVVLAGGCKRYERIDEPVTAPAPVVVTRGQEETEEVEQETSEVQIQVTTEPWRPKRTRAFDS